MTEEEAKTKWCPMVRMVVANADGGVAATNGTAGFNRLSEVTGREPGPCIASSCMWWRWVGPHFDLNDGRFTHPPEGYCGAVGNPDPA